MHLLRKAIKKHDKRRKKEQIFNEKKELENCFKKWRDISLSTKSKNEEKVNEHYNSEVKNENNENENKEKLEINNNKIETNLKNNNENENQILKEKNDIDEQKNNIEEKDNKKNNELKNDKKIENNEASHKDNIVSSINDLIELNNKIQDRTLDIINKFSEKTYNKIEPEIYIKILELNNKRILSYKLFSLYANYKENESLKNKNISPKKKYFNYWQKTLNKK